MNDGLIKNLGLKEVIRIKHEEIKKVYLNDLRPWILGYSGGKDSTAMLQLVYNAISELPIEKRQKPIYVVSSDTLVENPLILNYLQHNINKINTAAQKDNLPITATLVRPKETDTFWTLLIGKGYPSPRQKFRWCTSRLKINPIDDFIDEQTTKHEEVIVILGVRRAESQSRQLSIESKTVEGKILKMHTSNSKAYVYAPIEDFSLTDIWSYLNIVPNPWNGNNKTLLSLYRDSSDDSECPIQRDPDAPSCGQSRFGCWICTVVAQDKSLTGFISNGYDDLGPLLKYRNWLCSIREREDYRQKWRMNGSMYFLSTEDNKKKQGFGPFNLVGRKKMLQKLLQAEIVYNQLLEQRPSTDFDQPDQGYVHLIQLSELRIIRDQWIKDGDWEDSLPEIYKKVTGSELPISNLNKPLLANEELDLLEQICEDHDLPSNIIKKLLLIEDKFSDIKIRRGLMKEIDSILRQDWVHEEILQELMGEENQDEAE
jgi:DNA sulfur modification protein DndC